MEVAPSYKDPKFIPQKYSTEDNQTKYTISIFVATKLVFPSLERRLLSELHMLLSVKLV